jgi:Zn-dependent peptidase ImmA (M78 family)
VSIAARAITDTRAADETAVGRMQALAELSQILADGGLPAFRASRLEAAPDVDCQKWWVDAPLLADWAREILQPRSAPTEALLDELAEAIEDLLGVDILMEPHGGEMLGATATLSEWRCIYVNTARPRRQQLFTLAHELGHLLAGDSAPLRADLSLKNSSPWERFANTFAASFLMPENLVREVVGEQLTLRTALQAFDHFGVSIDALSWRLYSLGYLTAEQRPAFAARPAHVWAVDLSPGDNLRDAILRTQTSATHSSRSPRLMTQRAFDGWQSGVVSVRPYAALTGEDPEQLIFESTSETAFAF